MHKTIIFRLKCAVQCNPGRGTKVLENSKLAIFNGQPKLKIWIAVLEASWNNTVSSSFLVATL